MVEYKNKDYESNRILSIAEKFSKKDFNAVRTPGFQNLILSVYLQIAKKQNERNKDR